jgi:acyl-CoA thioesterase
LNQSTRLVLTDISQEALEEGAGGPEADELKHARTKFLAYMQGMDSTEPDLSEVEIVRKAKKLVEKGDTIFMSSLPAYLEKVKKAIFKKVETEPFAQKFGIKLLDLEEGYSKVEMRLTPDMENLFGMAHGGALFALIDEAFETASNSHGTMAVALNLNVTFISSPRPGSRLIAEAQEFSKTHRTAGYDIKVFDDKKESDCFLPGPCLPCNICRPRPCGFSRAACACRGNSRG